MQMSSPRARRLSRRTALVAAAVGAGAVPAFLAGSANADVTAPVDPGFWPTISGQQWTIQRGNQVATFVELGGGLFSYTVNGVPFVESYPLDSPIKSAGRTLCPWPNRLQDGQYTFNGVAQQVPINEVAPRNNAIHGLSRWLAYRRVKQTRDTITLTALIAPQQGYPWPLQLVTKWSLGSRGLRVEHNAINLGPAPAPFGLGAHPYFRVGDALIDNCVLESHVTERVVVDPVRLLPTGREPVAGTPYDFSTPHAMGAIELDTAFTGLARGSDGLARTRLTAPGGLGLEVWQDKQFGWVQLFTGLGPGGRPRGTLAIEPMTCPPNAFHSGENVITLAPHARWKGTWGVTPFGA
jgi:aldose 1-epimerase